MSGARTRLRLVGARRLSVVAGGLATVTLLAGCTSSAARATPAVHAPSPTHATHAMASAARPVAVTFDGLPQVGALFPSASDHHFCTASVVHSPTGNVIATAAHCVVGTGAGLMFVPGYHDGIAPYGRWSVQASYVSARWLRDQDPLTDYAFLTVSPQSRGGRPVEVEQVVGADELVVDRGRTAPVTVVAYPAQSGGRPIICTTAAYPHLGYPGFDCRGYVVGTSGGPWITDYDQATGRGGLYGLIGGLHQGGCTPDTSYSPYFDADTAQVFDRAVQDDPGDDVPAAGSDGC